MNFYSKLFRSGWWKKNLGKIFVLRLFISVVSQIKWFRFEQSFIIKYVVAEKRNPSEIYRGMHDVYAEECFSQNMFTNG